MHTALSSAAALIDNSEREIEREKRERRERVTGGGRRSHRRLSLSLGGVHSTGRE
jgi:hypothetical protein